MFLDDAKMRKAYIRPLEPIDLSSATEREQSSLYFGRERAHGQGAGATVDAKNKVLYPSALLHYYLPSAAARLCIVVPGLLLYITSECFEKKFRPT